MANTVYASLKAAEGNLTRKLNAKASLIEQLTSRDDYDGDTQEQVKSLLRDVEEIKEQLNKMRADDEQVGDDEKSEKEDEERDAFDEDGNEDEANRSRWKNHPAIVRQAELKKGTRSANSIVDHSKLYKYSITRAAHQVATERVLNGLEGEADQEMRRIRRAAGQKVSGQWIMPSSPLSALNKDERLERSANLTTSTGSGAVPTYWQDFIDYLYPTLVCAKLGVTFLDGLQAGTKLPRMSGVPTMYGVAESSAAPASNPTVDEVQLTPYAVSANTTISKLFALQSVVAADKIVMDSLRMQTQVKMDYNVIAGSGTSNNPTGILNNSVITNIQRATGNAVSYTDTVACETQVANSNAYQGNLGWLTSPNGYQYLLTTAKIGSTFPVFLVDDNGNINGHPCVRSTQVPNNLTYSGTSNVTSLIFGAWQYAICAGFGQGIELIVDPLTGSTAGDLTITSFLYMDTNVMHSGGFAIVPNLAS